MFDQLIMLDLPANRIYPKRFTTKILIYILAIVKRSKEKYCELTTIKVYVFSDFFVKNIQTKDSNQLINKM